MGAGVIEERIRVDGPVGLFESPEEMREVLDRLLADIDSDRVAGPAMRLASVPYRFVFPDAGLVLDVTGSEEPGHCLRWTFEDDEAWTPTLSMEMASDVANRFLQGRENLAIGMARGLIRVSCGARAALSFLPASREMIGRYRAIIERDYPHLVLH